MKDYKKIQQELERLFSQRILVIDGAMGTMLQKHKLEEDDFRGDKFQDHKTPLKGNNDLLCLTRPEIIEEIHTAYFQAGADIIETNSFNGTSIAQEDYGLQNHVAEINKASAQIGSKAAEKFMQENPDRSCFVAGAMGPTNRTCSISPDVNNPGFRAVTFDQMATSYKEQAEALLEGGADLLLVETCFDTLNLKAAIYAIKTIEEENKLKFRSLFQQPSLMHLVEPFPDKPLKHFGIL